MLYYLQIKKKGKKTMKNKKTLCTLAMVYLQNEEGIIEYGNLASIHDLPKSKVDKATGERIPIHYEQTYYEKWQQRKTQKIVDNLNAMLVKRYRGKKDIHYFVKLEQVKIAL